MNSYIIGVVGNPNCGKTTLFNALTGSKQQVGNWPSVTVDRKTGHYKYEDKSIELVDLPGIYSLDIAPGHTSIDEEIAQNYILSGDADLIINIVDASNLERNLYLTTQLLDMGVPVVVVLNMMDVVHSQGHKINVATLQEQLGVPVLAMSAALGEGVKEFREQIDKLVEQRPLPETKFQYQSRLENALQHLGNLVKTELAADQEAHQRWITLKLLEGDPLYVQSLAQTLITDAENLRLSLETEFEEDIDILIADSRYSFIHAVVEAGMVKASRLAHTVSDRIDQIVLNRIFGIPLFLLIMYLMFMFTINIGGAFIDFFDILVGTFLVDGLAYWLEWLGIPIWLNTLISNGVGGGIQVVATFIPIIACLFLFLSFLEDSGYMARAAFVMDRFMRMIGLPGKSFVPMIVGFGCNVPAIMATRTLENPRERYMTVLMNPFMSCGARLPVYALFAAAFFPAHGQNLVFGLYLLGIFIAVLTGLIMKYTLLQGSVSHFVMELPSYHVPTFRSVILRTWERLKGFVIRAGKVIVPMVVVITFLNAWGTDGSFGNEDSDKSVLSEIGRTLTPAFEPMGINEDNWPATVGIFTGVLAKEVVVGTLDAIYSKMDTAQDPSGEAQDFDFWGSIGEAFATIPKELGGLSDKALDPIGVDVGDISNQEIAAEQQEVDNMTFGAMVERFDGTVGAFAYLLFVLMYFPCVAATAAIYRETGPRWAIFVAAWTTGIGYMSAVIFYQVATFSRHPVQSIAWIIGLLLVFVITIIALRVIGHTMNETTFKVEEEAVT